MKVEGGFQMEDPQRVLSFVLNGVLQKVVDPCPKQTLAEYVRNVGGLKGTKVMCNQGGCGACTVVVTDPLGPNKEPLAVNSCLKPLCSVEGMAVTTVEGVGSLKAGLHPIQQSLVDANGSQCGFCTPGMVMSMYGLSKKTGKCTQQAVEDQLDGNLCRCTGYRPILDAYHNLASCDASACAGGVGACDAEIEDLCRKTRSLRAHTSTTGNGATAAYTSRAATRCATPESTRLGTWYGPLGETKWVQVRTLAELFSVLRTLRKGLSASTQIRMIVGNTSTGVYPLDEMSSYVFVDIARVAELNEYGLSCDALSIGGAVTIAQLMELLEKHEKTSPNFKPLLEHLGRVASPLVRNAGSVAGNLALTRQHREFASDVATILSGTRATLTVADTTADTTHDPLQKEMLVEDYLALGDADADGVIILRIHIPVLSPSERLYTHKVALRRVNAHALVNIAACFALDTTAGTIVGQPTIVFGGLCPGLLRAKRTESLLAGAKIGDSDTLQKALGCLVGEAVASPEAFGRREYRQWLASALFYKAYLSLSPRDALPPRLRSAAVPWQRPISTGQVSYSEEDPSEYPVTKPLHKLSAKIQTTGEAQFVDDLPHGATALHGAYVISEYGNAAIVSIDAASALQAPGVKAFLSAETLRTDGYCNFVSEVEELFASKRVAYYGQAVGLIIADSAAHAATATKLVKVTYGDIKKPILDFEDAISAGSFYPNSKRTVVQGSAEDGFKSAAVIAEGQYEVGWQYPFHMETQSTLACPAEDGGMRIYPSSQNPSQIQQVVAAVLNLPQHKVAVEIKRIGGAYGVKINRATPNAAATAIAAHKLGVPVKTIMDLSTNMQLVGGRSPYRVKYKLGAAADGKLVAIQMRLFQNSGAHSDIDGYPDFMACFYFLDNVYSCPNWDLEGVVCRTNNRACTWIRGPGYFESVSIMETAMEHLAHVLHLPPDLVRKNNLYKPGQVSPTGQCLTYCNADLVVDKVRDSSAYAERARAVDDFNAANRWIKRGLQMTPVRFGFFWAGAQFQALVNIFPDSSISIVTAGIEMGQGLHVKVAAVAAMELGKTGVDGVVPVAGIRIDATDSHVANNACSSGSSTTSELCSLATQAACVQLVARLKPLAAAMRGACREGAMTWSALVSAAVGAGVDLQSRGRVDPPPRPDGSPCQYASYGAAVSEAEIDVLTGEQRILRTDIVLDCGESLNPAVDVGQVQGGFVMGLGYHLTEEYVFDHSSNSGQLLSHDTWEYKVPSNKDIPIDMRVSLLQKSGNPHGLLRSKGSGEPPMAMSVSAVLAIHSAVHAARDEEFGIKDWVSLNSPGTVENVSNAIALTIDKLDLTDKGSGSEDFSMEKN